MFLTKARKLFILYGKQKSLTRYGMSPRAQPRGLLKRLFYQIPRLRNVVHRFARNDGKAMVKDVINESQGIY